MGLLRAGACALGLIALAAAPLAAAAAPRGNPLRPSALAPAAGQAKVPAEPEQSVPVADITARAQSAVEEVRSLEAALARADEVKSLRADLSQLSERIGPAAVEVSRQLTENPSIATLSQLSEEWDGLARQLEEREAKLRALVNALEQQASGLKSSEELWNRTIAFEQKRGTPVPILDAARNAAAELRRGGEAVQKAQQEALVLQNEYASLHATVQATLDGIAQTRQGLLDNLLVRDNLPLWRVDLLEQLGEFRAWQLGSFLRDLGEQTERYAQQHPEPIALHLLLFAALVWALRSAHEALRRDQPESAAADESSPVAGALLATQHPVAAAMVVALLFTPLLHDLPRVLTSVLRLVFALPAVVVLRPLLGSALRAPLYLLVGFFLVDRVREILTGSVAPFRVVFMLEMLVLAGVLAALLHRRRLENFPAVLRGNRWLKVLALWLRLSAMIAVLAALVSVAGYMRLAGLLGGGVLGSGYAALVLFAFLRIAEGMAAALFGGQARSSVRMLEHNRALLLSRTGRLLRFVAVVLWVLAVMNFFGVREAVFQKVSAGLSAQIGYGEFQFTLGGVIAFALTLFGAWLIARMVQFVLDEEVFPRLSLSRGVPFALATLSRYAILLLGFLVALSALGFDLDRITILLGAFGVGIGFGLQTIVNNFVSGLILLFERPVKVGDVVALPGVEGTVQRIGIRASTVRTGDGADVIVPNGVLIASQVTNWTLSDRMRRLSLRVSVVHGSDLQAVLKLLQDVAGSVEGVARFPKPAVAFVGFGESSLDFDLLAWCDDLDGMLDLRNRLALAVQHALTGAGIEIAEPRRALHVTSVASEAAAALRGAKPDGG